MKYKALWLIASCLFLGGGSLTASPDDEFDPENPAEPSAIDFCRVTVSATPEEGAYVSGGGKYTVNGSGSVYISTNARNDENFTYNFLYWTMNGQRTSYSQSFWFTPTKGNFEFVAHYLKTDTPFEPENPEEPSTTTVKRKYHLYLTTNMEGACSFNMASGNKVQEQSQFYVEAYTNAEYQFEAWKLNGETICTDPWLWFTMPSADTTLEAVFSEIPFDPENPMDPGSQGGNIDNSSRKFINLTIGSGVTSIDKTRIVINEQKTLGYDNGADAAKFISTTAACQLYSLDGEGTLYSINERPKGDGKVLLGIMAKTACSLTIVATRLDCTAYLVDKLTGDRHDLALGGYTFTTEAGTYDDRFYILLGSESGLLGDVNSDGKVTPADAIMILYHYFGVVQNEFNINVADVNGDTRISPADAIEALYIYFGASGNSRAIRPAQEDVREPE